MYSTLEDIYNNTEQQGMSRHKRAASDATAPPHTVLSAVQRFVSAVNSMNDTIMVPCRLLDMEINSNRTNKTVPELLRDGQDPYILYGVLNSTKNDLMYGLPAREEEVPLKKDGHLYQSDRWSSRSSENQMSSAQSTVSSHSSHSSTTSKQQSTTSANSTTAAAGSSSNNKQQPARKISSLSMMSLGSSTSSCDSSTESDITEETEETEFCLGTEDSGMSSIAQTSAELRTHLSGLYNCLNLLSDSAYYLTDRYQEELSNGI